MIFDVIERFDGEYRFLSNFFPSPIVYVGGEWPTVEHAYQGSKAVTQADMIRVQFARTPGEAKRIGRAIPVRPDWNDIRLPVMLELLHLKFAIGTALAFQLLKTGDAELIEGNTWGDRYWGVCNGRGENWLGRCLMKVRHDLRTLPMRRP